MAAVADDIEHTHQASHGVLGAIGHGLAGRPLGSGWALAAFTVLVGGLALLVLYSAKLEISGNPASRVSTMEGVVDHNSWETYGLTYSYKTVDKVLVNGVFYSSKPPVYSLMGAVVYAGLERVTGWTLAELPQRVMFWLRLLLHVLPFGICALALGRFAGRFLRDDGVWFWMFSAFAVGTLAFAYSSTINNHAAAAVLITACLIATVTILERARTAWWVWFGTGFAACLAVTFDLGAGTWALGMGAVLLFGKRQWGVLWLIAGAVLPAVVHLLLTEHVTGSLLPFYNRSELYAYRGSYWNNPGNFDALSEPSWLYTFHSLVGHHGLFAMTPVFLLSIPGVATMLRTRGDRLMGVLVGLVALGTIVVYLFWGPNNYGGTASGMRWFIVLVPLLWLAAAKQAARWSSSTVFQIILAILVTIGAVHAIQIVIHGQWEVSQWNFLLRKWGLGSVAPYNLWP